MLVAGHSKLKIPVSCVEQGRWQYKSRKFGAGGSHSPSKLRRTLKASVTKSAREKLGHVSDQGGVWDEVDAIQACCDVKSPTDAMADVFEAHRDALAEQRERLQYVEGATGVALAGGGKVVAVDLFDKPATCRKVWDRLLSGVLFDSLKPEAGDQQGSMAELQHAVERTLKLAADLPWEQVDAVGEGEEYRSESPQGDHASALVFADAVIHGSVLPAG